MIIPEAEGGESLRRLNVRGPDAEEELNIDKWIWPEDGFLRILKRTASQWS